jgi:hypothetical protein
MEEFIVMGTTGKSNGIAVEMKQFFLLELKKRTKNMSTVNVFSEHK